MVEQRAGRCHFALTQLRIQDSWQQLVLAEYGIKAFFPSNFL
jgi:hypothetical protein